MIREAFADGALLHAALANETARTLVLGHPLGIDRHHLRANAHPLNSELLDASGPYVVGALNGDVDNFADLIAEEGVTITSITTDAEVIPSLTSRRLGEGLESEAFRRTVATFQRFRGHRCVHGGRTGQLQLALRGSVRRSTSVSPRARTSSLPSPMAWLRRQPTMSAWTADAGNPENPSTGRGQIIELDGELAGTVEGMLRKAYDGTDLAVAADDIAVAFTTRDIDRGDHPHYLMKEIGESPTSFRKKLRGKIVETDAGLRVSLGPSVIPDEIRELVRNGTMRRCSRSGSTAAVAGQAPPPASMPHPNGEIEVEAVLATELSGRLRPDERHLDRRRQPVRQPPTPTARSTSFATEAPTSSRSSTGGGATSPIAPTVCCTPRWRDVGCRSPQRRRSTRRSPLASCCRSPSPTNCSVTRWSTTALLKGITELPAAMETVLDRRDIIGEAARQFAAEPALLVFDGRQRPQPDRSAGGPGQAG